MDCLYCKSLQWRIEFNNCNATYFIAACAISICSTGRKYSKNTLKMAQDIPPIQEARTWTGDGWTAQVIKNEDDDGWAVAMTQDGQAEPALVGPWTMGRDKKRSEERRVGKEC